MRWIAEPRLFARGWAGIAPAEKNLAAKHEIYGLEHEAADKQVCRALATPLARVKGNGCTAGEVK
jgi:hypothetical protein